MLFENIINKIKSHQRLGDLADMDKIEQKKKIHKVKVPCNRNIQHQCIKQKKELMNLKTRYFKIYSWRRRNRSIGMKKAYRKCGTP